MGRTKCSALIKKNLPLFFFVFLVWLVAEPSVMFSTTGVIDTEFPGDVGSWSVSGNAGNATFDSDKISAFPYQSERTQIYKSYPLVKKEGSKRYFRISGKYSGIAGVVKRPKTEVAKKKRKSIIYAWFENETREKVLVRILVVSQDVGVERSFSATILEPQGAINLNVGMLLRQYTSGLSFKDLEIVQLQHTSAYLLSRVLFWVVVFLMAVKICIRVYRNNMVASALKILSILTLLLLGILLPGDTLFSIVNSVLAILPFADMNRSELDVPTLQNIGHFLGFAVLSFLVLYVSFASGLDAVDVMIKLIIFAVLAEVLQRHVVFRSSNIGDVLLNVGGLLVGALVWYLIRLVRRDGMA